MAYTYGAWSRSGRQTGHQTVRKNAKIRFGCYRPSSTLSTILASLFPALPAPLQSPINKYSFRSVYFDARAGNNHDDRARGGDRLWKSRELGRIDGRDFVRELGVIER